MAFFPGKGDSIHSKEPKMPKKRAFDKGEGGVPDPPFWHFWVLRMVGRQTLANLRLVQTLGMPTRTHRQVLSTDLTFLIRPLLSKN